MLAKVHIAKKQLGLAEDDYRAVLNRVAGRMSAGECSAEELEKLLAEFAAKGFTAKARQGSGAGAPRPADHPSAKKARALWISLHHLGAIADPSEKALEAFARRQLKVQRLQWADQALAYKLIEALKAIGERHGWAQGIEGIPANATVLVLKRRLVKAIQAKLVATGVVPEDWRLSRVVMELTGEAFVALVLATSEELDTLAKALGDRLREATRAIGAAS